MRKTKGAIILLLSVCSLAFVGCSNAVDRETGVSTETTVYAETETSEILGTEAETSPVKEEVHTEVKPTQNKGYTDDFGAEVPLID